MCKLDFKFKCLALAVMLSLNGVNIHSAQAIGVGIATYDNTAEMNAIQELSRWLTQLEDNITSLKNEAQMLYNPGISVFRDVSDSYRDLRSSVGGITSAINSARNSVEYVKEKFGDPDYWIQCAQNGCDPSAQLESAYRAVNNAINSAIAMSSEVSEMTSDTQEQISEIVNESGNAGDEGINASIVRLNELQGLNAQLTSQLILLQQAQMQAQATYMQEISHRRKLNEESNREFFKKPVIPDHDYPLNPEEW